MDCRKGKIDNRLIWSGILIGTAMQCLMRFPNGVADYLGALILPVTVCWLLFRSRALGAGDIKLFCVIGCINGCRILFDTLIVSFVIAACYALYHLCRRRQLIAALSEVFLYIREISIKGRILPYAGRSNPDRLMHFSVAILAGYALTGLGVIAGVDLQH